MNNLHIFYALAEELVMQDRLRIKEPVMATHVQVATDFTLQSID